MCHRWIQLPISKYEKMCEDGEVFGGQGYRYTNDKNETYIEFHVDDNETLTAIGDTMPFGGNLSVRKPLHKKPLIIFGQDECIFKQYIFRNKCWNGPNGEVPLMPKDEGQGLMISAFVSRKYGFSWDLTQSQLQLVNQYRQDKQYIDEVSAITKRGTAKKDNLTTSPFRRDLQYGANNEGYWSYEDMIIQVEDCIDCLRAIHGDTYQFLFLFDHSNGHDRTAPDALKADAISKYHGGKQPIMRDSIILDKSYLGPFHHDTKLQIGNTQ